MCDESPDWHFQDWMAYFEKKQAALTNELGWNKSKANHVWHGRQEYRRETVNEVAQWLGIKPYELLMAPAEAMALRRLRESAAQIVADQVRPADPPAPATARRRTGTKG